MLFRGVKSPIEFFMQLLVSPVIIFIVLPLHECAHGYVAYKLGDPTAKDSGRLTLNPLAHLNLLGSIGIFFFGIGWANPVPIDPRYFKNQKLGIALTALAGPVSNILAAFVGCILFVAEKLFVTSQAAIFGMIKIFLFRYIQINVNLAIFNLIPIPPLDGSRIISYFLPEQLEDQYYAYQNILNIGLIILVFTGVLNRPLALANNAVIEFLMSLASIIFGGK